MDAADPEVADLDPGRQLRLGHPPGHLDAEPVVAEEDVADPGHQVFISKRLHFVRREVAEPALQPGQVGARVVVDVTARW